MTGVDKSVGIDYRLEDGACVRLRPVEPGDRQRLQEAFAQLSPHSRYLRFFGHLKKLSSDLLDALTQVDQRRHVAWCAVDPTRPGSPGLGLGRYHWLDEQTPPKTAEWAVTVIDSWQHRRLGVALLAVLLVRARQQGLMTLQAQVMADNDLMRDWLMALGATWRLKEGVYDFDLAVRPEQRQRADSPSAVHLQQVVETLAPYVRGPGA